MTTKDTANRDTISKLYKSNIVQPLKGFCRVIEEGSITAAADKYGATAGLFTKQIKWLERQLGMKLFDRGTGSGMVPNQVGLDLYNRSAGLVSNLESLIYDFTKEKDDEKERVLNIGANYFVFEKMFPSIKSFKEKNNNVDMNIDLLEQDEAIDHLKDRKIDIFISSKEINEEIHSKLCFIKLADYVPYWVLWKGHPLENKQELTKEDILSSELFFDESNISMKSLMSFLKSYRIKKTININGAGLDIHKMLIKNKFGISLIFSSFINKSDKRYLIFKNASNLFPIGEYGCYLNIYHKQIAKKFVNYLIVNKSLDNSFLSN